MGNALAKETSPYLRQHAENPVDWLPWGPVALARAREEDKPLLVSIGYSACHWCHVMERESFEDERTAALMNEGFVCVKVDREERPDVDSLYMEAVQGMTGRGGWPLNVFLTPEQLPFYGGTYFPPEPRHGMPAWTQVLQAIGETWSERREEIGAGSEHLRERLSGGALLKPSAEPLTEDALEQAIAGLTAAYDARHGGFGGAPKFPQASVIELLIARATGRGGRASEPGGELPAGRSAEAEMALHTLGAMASGGVYDQIGGGFHRYAVDATWTVPHFEKMLYDNALLARAYLHGFKLSAERRLEEVCRETLDWALREMRGPEGGFYAALDADSDGVEGQFYVWSVDELQQALGDDARAAIAWFGVTERGNFEDPHHPRPGLNVLQARDRSAAPPTKPVVGQQPPPEQRERIRARLLSQRASRTRPGLDDKRLTGWNALMISALADAGTALDEARYVDAARACAQFVLRELRDEHGRLLRTWSAGRASIDAYLEDHAFLLEALIALFEAGCEERWLTEARELADTLIARFADPENGGFYSTASDGEALIVRRKELEDTPIPAGGSSAAMGLLRLAELTGEEEYERQALGAIALLREIAPRHPTAFGHMLQAMHWRLSPMRPIACAVPGPAPMPAARGVPARGA
ncbi:MAG TPA: thioredoxin domain-containing protein [Solirubrobacteraceae bacterium]|nr:thioredoxin domain-containing protein [Solirubrobacteraceae bacterium]